MTDVFQQRVQRLDRSVRAREAIAEAAGASTATASPAGATAAALGASSAAAAAAVAAAVSGGGGVTPSPVAVAAMGNAGLLLDDAILSEQCSAAELTFFREGTLLLLLLLFGFSIFFFTLSLLSCFGFQCSFE
jgi:hypothetical protein